MRRHSAIFTGLAVVALSGGCHRAEPAASAPSATAPAVAVSAKPTVAAAPAAPPAAAPPAQPAAGPPLPTAIKDDRSTSPGKNHAVRVALLTPGGPLIVDVTLTIDGQPQNEAFEKLLDKVLEAADTDRDQQATWKELAANEEFLKQQPDSGSPTGARDLKMWTDQFDRNQDDRIQRDEASDWLGRAAGRKAHAFDVRSSRSYFSVPSASSRIWKLLDADSDGQLSGAELGRCANTLEAFDDDDDGVVASEEIEPLGEQLRAGAGGGSRTGRGGNPFAALYLERNFAADRLEYLLTDLYAPQQKLEATRFPSLAAQFQPLDANGDGRLDQEEIAQLLTNKPHFKVAVDFTNANAEGAGAVTSLTVTDPISELTVIGQPATGRIVLALGATRLVMFAQDFTAGVPPAQAAAASQVRLMVHDRCDALGELLDSDADGRLGERDVAASAQTLLKYDADHDGQLQNNELPYSMIVAFLRGERPGDDSFYRPRSEASRPAQTGAPTWFIRADFNGDGDISRREFLGTGDQLSRLDANRDDFISAAEAAARNE